MTFKLEGGGVALSEVTVTDQRDESGRAGIRRAVIDVMPPGDFHAHLQKRWDSYSYSIQSQVERRLNGGLRARIWDRSMPKFNKEPQIVFSAAYSTPADWEVIEALVIKLMLAPITPMRRWGKIIPFTTLALDHREESRVVVLPEDRAQRVDDNPVIYL
jgi:hypothetical protein